MPEDRCCGTCRHHEHKGYVAPNWYGSCRYEPVPWYAVDGHRLNVLINWVASNEGQDCPCWAEKEQRE